MVGFPDHIIHIVFLASSLSYLKLAVHNGYCLGFPPLNILRAHIYAFFKWHNHKNSDIKISCKIEMLHVFPETFFAREDKCIFCSSSFIISKAPNN